MNSEELRDLVAEFKMGDMVEQDELTEHMQQTLYNGSALVLLKRLVNGKQVWMEVVPMENVEEELGTLCQTLACPSVPVTKNGTQMALYQASIDGLLEVPKSMVDHYIDNLWNVSRARVSLSQAVLCRCFVLFAPRVCVESSLACVFLFQSSLACVFLFESSFACVFRSLNLLFQYGKMRQIWTY